MRLVRSKMFPLVVGYLMAAGIAQAQPVPADDEGEEIKPIDEPDDKKSDDKKSDDKKADDKKADDKKAKPPKQSKGAPVEAGDSSGAEGDLDPARPPKKGKGAIWGVLTDKRSEEPMMEAVVTVEGTKLRAITDLDGRYRLELPPGTYTLRFWAELHKAEILKNVHVEEGKGARLDAVLQNDEGAVDVVEVVTEADKTAVEGQILSRQRASAVGDSVGRAEIARTPDKNAAQAAQRVVGATVVGNRFVFVRGLGERYTNALLNGAPLPSPEPDRAAVPLDLFPTITLDSLTIAKTFTPDVPGDFAGGSVRVETRRIPSKFIFQSSLSGSYNSQSTFRDRLSYKGGSTDWLGFDDGFRALPPGFPSYKLTTGAPKPGGGNVTDQDVDSAGRDVNSFFSSKRAFTPPDHSLSVAVGNAWKLGRESRLGALVALNYGHSYQIRTDEESNDYAVSSNGSLARQRSYLVDTGNETASWGAFASTTYELNAHHRFTLIGLHSQIADKTVTVAEGFKDVAAQLAVHDTRLAFVSRAQNLGQLGGEHVLPELGGSEIDWRVWLSNASRNEPDTRNVAWQLTQGSTTWSYADDSYSGRHFWAEQSEGIKGGQLDFTTPIADDDSKLKFGGFVNLRRREFTSRAMAFRRSSDLALSDYSKLNCASKDFDACADSLFFGSNIGPVVRLSESTLPVDAYNADLDVYATYFMVDASLSPWFRVIAGERLEVTRQTIEPFDQFSSEPQESAGIDSTDLLPALGTVFTLTKRSKLRTSLTRTLARPQLRELAPFAYSDFFGGRFVSGNPDLKMTRIINADLRFEFFPTLKEVLATTVFYKRFSDPIETVAIASGDRGLVTFQNAEGADLYGMELEARKDLGFLSRSLKEFTGIANLTLAQSRIQLSGAAREYLTNASRPMTNQAPWVLNLALDYAGSRGTTVRLLYNVAGKRIVQVGSQDIPDAYEHPRHVIDLSASQDINSHFQVKASASNILNAPHLVTQGPDHDAPVVSKYTSGSVVSVGATYTY